MVKDKRHFILAYPSKSVGYKELLSTFYNLRKIFSKNLVDFKVHTILEILKFDPVPRSILIKSHNAHLHP